MSHLKEILQKKNISQAELSDLLGMDKTTINRWSKNSREISWGNALKISKVLSIHPVELFDLPKDSKTKLYVDVGCEVKEYSEERKIKVPYEFKDCLKVFVDNYTYARGVMFFKKEKVKNNELKRFKKYLVYCKDKIYCGSIFFDDFPYNGEVKIRDILDQTTTNIGHIENIDKLYQFACHQY
tara:strand:+ start:261 stop:809 length:549 start_codon:yes stop_codon:yes gene_type:complete